MSMRLINTLSSWRSNRREAGSPLETNFKNSARAFQHSLANHGMLAATRLEGVDFRRSSACCCSRCVIVCAKVGEAILFAAIKFTIRQV